MDTMERCCLVMLAVVAACSGGNKAGPSPVAETRHREAKGKAAAPAPPPCPGEAELESRVRAATELPQTHDLSVTSCVPGAFGAPGWHVRFVAIADGSLHGELILAADGDRVLASSEPFESYTTFAWDHAVEVHDLDGDGVDEIVDVHTREMRLVATTTEVSVERLDGDDLASWFSAPVTWDDSLINDTDPSICDGKVTVERSKVIAVTTTTVSPAAAREQRCAEGTQRFGLVDGKWIALP